MPDRGSIKGGHIAQTGKIKENLLQKLTPRFEGLTVDWTCPREWPGQLVPKMGEQRPKSLQDL